jgi:glycosyltransferase involved in cell wall biosynthesis
LKKLAIISSHPIQYNAPLFALLAKEPEMELKVFYTWGKNSIKDKYDPDFQQKIQWDIPLLEGYQYQFLDNTSKDPGSHHFYGIINPDLNAEIDKWGADMVWVWGWSFASHLNAIRYFKGKKEVWFRGDSTLLDEPLGFSIKKIFRRFFLKWVYRHVDKAFYVGTHNKAYFIKHGLQESQLVYAPHAVDSKRFESDDLDYHTKASLWRSQLGIKPHQKVLLFSGKLEPKKNPLFLLDLINSIHFKEFVVLFVGAGNMEQELKERANNQCVFLGFQNQSLMPVIYRMADLYILPSIGPNETWGLSINESLASGTPVFASNRCGGAIDLIQTPKQGLVIDPFQVAKVREQVLTWFLQNATKGERLLIGHNYTDIISAVKQQLKV